MKMHWQQYGGSDEDIVGHKSGICEVAASLDGSVIASISYQDRGLIIWNPQLRPVYQDIQGGYNKIRNLAVSPDARYLLVVYESRARIRDFTTGEWSDFPTYDTGAIAFTLDSKSVVLAARNISVLEIDPKGWRHQLPFTETESWVHQVALAPDGRHMISSARVGWPKRDLPDEIKIWDIIDYKLVVAIEQDRMRTMIAIAPYERPFLLISAHADDVIEVWDWQARKKLGEFKSGHSSRVTCLAFSPDGRNLVTGSADGGLFVRDGQTFKITRRCAGHDRDVTSIAITGDGQRLVSGSEDHTVRQWDIQTGHLLHRTFSGQVEQ